MAHYDQGDYECEITGQGFDESKEKKTPFFWLSFRPRSSDGAAVENSYERVVKQYLTDNTIEGTVTRLKALGWDGATFRDLEPGGSCNLAGKTVTLHCSHEQNGSAVYERWEWPGPASKVETRHVPMSKKLDALFGKALSPKARKPAASVPERTPEPAKASAMPDDDIPF